MCSLQGLIDFREDVNVYWEHQETEWEWNDITTVSSTISTGVGNTLMWISDGMSHSKHPAIQYVRTENTASENIHRS